MTRLNDGTIVTDLNSFTINAALLDQGYSVRHIETWHTHDGQSFIHWDAPQISIADLPY
jgi:hypothetical protein